jgi:hypothetical protein
LLVVWAFRRQQPTLPGVRRMSFPSLISHNSYICKHKGSGRSRPTQSRTCQTRTEIRQSRPP